MSETYGVIAMVPVEAAYAYVADFPRHVEWSPDSLKIEPSQSGPAVAGSTFKTVGLLHGKPNPSEIEVVVAEPSRVFSFRSRDNISEWLHEFRFAPADGGTRIDRQVTVLKAPALLKIIWPIMHPLVIGPGNRKSMGMLRDRLESLTAKS